MPVGLEPRTELPPEFCPTPPTLEGTLLDVDAPEWAAVLCAAQHAPSITDAGRITRLPLVIRDIPGGGFDAASREGYPSPVRMGSEDPALLRVALIAGLSVLREAGIVSMLVDERSHQGAACPTPALCWA